MRKHLAALLSLLVAAMLVAGCASGSAPTSSPSQPESTEPDSTAEAEITKPDSADEVAAASDDAANTNSESEESESLKAIGEEIASDGTMGAVWYLGMYEGDIASDDFDAWLSAITYEDGTPLLDRYPFMADITAKASIEGSDIYCLVPAHAGDSVSICEWLYSTSEDGQWSEEAGTTFYSSDTGEPVLIQASAGEFNPNFAVTLHDTDERIFDSHLFVLSGRDGKLVLPAGENGKALLTDLSPYVY